MRLAFPVYSRTATSTELRRLHERATRVHAAVVVPLLAVLIVIAPVLVPWLFGDRWRPAVLPGPDPRGRGHDRRDPHRLRPGDARRRPAARADALQRRRARRLRRRRLGHRRARHRRRGDRRRRRLRRQLVARLRRPLPRASSGSRSAAWSPTSPPPSSAAAALLAIGFPLCEPARGLGAPAPVIVALVGITGLLAHVGVLRDVLPRRLARPLELRPPPAPRPAAAAALAGDSVDLELSVLSSARWRIHERGPSTWPWRRFRWPSVAPSRVW